MNRFLLAGLTTLALTTVTPSISQANPVSYNPNTVSQTSIRRIAPSDLVTMAQRGEFKAQGIPGAMRLTSEYVLGRIGAKDLVQGAIAAQMLPADAVNDSSYLNAVASQLQIHLRIN